jgi:hypothetical protein
LIASGENREKLSMSWLSRDKERDRYYLLPGMGKRAMRQKRMVSLVWAITVGLVVSVAFAAAVYWLATRASV